MKILGRSIEQRKGVERNRAWDEVRQYWGMNPKKIMLCSHMNEINLAYIYITRFLIGNFIQSSKQKHFT